MKTVFSPSELPHVWAHQKASEGRSSSRSRELPHVPPESFRGKSYYSYRAEIARIVERKGQRAYLLDDTSYSHTTSRHQAGVRRAIPEKSVVLHYEGDLGRVTPTELFEFAVKRAAEQAGKAERARASWSKDWHQREQQMWLERARTVAKFYGLRRKVDEKTIERLKEASRRAEIAARKLAAERQRLLEIEHAATLKAWLRGEAVSFPYSIQKCYLRAVDDEMQTSKGARVPLKDAKRALKFCRKMREKGWRRNGEQFKIGYYYLDAVNKTGVVAGCHHVTWEEIDRFAAVMGWK